MEEARSFLLPLAGKAITIAHAERPVNLALARTIVRSASKVGASCAVLDLDAFYSSNSEEILGSLSNQELRLVTIQVPEPGSDLETELANFLCSDSGVLVVDSLNTLYHLLWSEDGRTQNRKLAFAVACLSYIAKSDAKSAIITMYKRPGAGRPGSSRSISSLSETTVSAALRDAQLRMRCERGSAWPGGEFSIRTL